MLGATLGKQMLVCICHLHQIKALTSQARRYLKDGSDGFMTAFPQLQDMQF